jgi:NtrC-family two-component system sensor histidine kinase KinB
MKIRMKIMTGFLILAVMLAVAGVFSIYELKTIGYSVQSLLDDNYRSITAAKKMIESLEREDSGTLLLLSGKWKEGRQTIQSADKNFLKALETAENNLTIPNEKEYVDRIRERYNAYRKMWERPIVDTAHEGNLNWYLEEVHKAFSEVKFAAQELMSINDKAMYETASNLKNRAHRAVMPGIIAILSALVFSFLFNFFVNIYIVNPILSIIRSIKSFLEKEELVFVKIDTNDEIADLSSSVYNLAVMIKTSPKRTDFDRT